MKKSFFNGIIFIPCMLISLLSIGQTPGMIYEPATGSGTAVLDPNGDGYTSLTTAGFIVDDQLESELPFTSLVFPGTEPIADLDNAPDCGFTDFVDQGDRDPAQKYLDGTNNWIFRLRMGGSAPNAKSYSILIDTDGKFGNTGVNADPTYTLNNPGFEIEIVLATRFGVYVYDVNIPNCSPVISYPGTTNYQKSIAGSTNCGDLDYFYDFFVLFSDLTAQFGVTTSTPMRYAIVDNTAAMKSTVCNPSSASDVGGVGSCPNLATCYGEIIDAQGPCAPSQTVCPPRSACPFVTAPISGGATTMNGTSTEPNGTTITVYKNGASIGTTTVTGGAWSLSGITPSLAGNDTISATAQATGETVSDNSCSSVIVGSSCSAPITSLNICNSGKAIQGVAVVGAVIKLYYGTSTIPLNPSSGYNFTAGTPNTITAGTLPSTLSPTTNNWLWKCVGLGQSSSCTAGGPPCLADGAYRVTATEPGKCESTPVWFCLGSVGITATPTITTTPLTTASTSVSGTVAAPDNVAGATIILLVNGSQIATGTTIAGGAWTISSIVLHGCDTVTAKAIIGTKCLSNASNSVYVTSGVTAAPVLSGTYCTPTTINSVSGISSEANGTIIQVYENGVAEGSTTTVTSGAWTASIGISINPGNIITAKAIAPCKTQSVASAGITVGLQTIDALLAITTFPIIEQMTSVSGAGTNGNTIQLYIDNAPIGTPVLVSGGTWTVSPLNIVDLYPLGVVQATSTSPTGCASVLSAGVIVICIPPPLTLSVSPDTAIVCSSSVVANVIVTASTPLIVYQLTNGGVNSGSSVLGTGGNIILTSATLTSNTTLKVKAFKIPPGSCTAYLDDTILVMVNAYPTLALTVGASTNPVCAGISTNVTVAGSQVGFSYQLRDNVDNSLVGTVVAGTGGIINLPTGALLATTTFNVLAIGVSPSNCSGQLSSTITITVNPAPAAPTGMASQTFCSSSSPTVAGLTATGTSIQWYAAASGGSPLAGATILTNGTSYYATQTVGGCESITRFQVTVTLTTAPAATISYSGTPYCTSVVGSQAVTLTGTSGGTYSSTAGLTISAATGAVTPSSSTAGTYTVTYTIVASGGCALFTTTTSVTITTAPAATISYSGSPFCSSISTPQSASLTGTFGGTYSSTAGLTINAGTGEIIPSTSALGAYTVTYTIAASSGCPEFTTTSSVTISNGASATISYSGSPVCTNAGVQTVTITGTTGGTYSSTAGLTLNSSTGEIDPATSTAGMYTVTYFIPASGGCAAFSTTASVTIIAAPSATISYSGSPFCSGLVAAQSVTITGTTGGAYSSTAGLTINAATGAITPSSSTLGTYTVTYTVAASGGCAAFTTTTSVTITAAPTATITYAGTPFCSGIVAAQSVTLTGTSGGAYSSTSGLTINASTGAITPSSSTAGTYTVTYTVAASGGCAAFTTTTSVTINQTPLIPILGSNSPICISQTINLTASSAGATSYLWAGPNSFSSALQNPNIINASLIMSGTYSVTATDNGCTSLPASVTIVTQDCSPIANMDTISVYEDSTVIIEILGNDTDPQNNIDSTSVVVISPPNNGFVSIGVGGVLVYTPNPDFNGPDTLIYQICDNSLPVPFCDTAIVYITVTPVNDAPIVTDTTITTPEDSTITVCLPILDVDAGQTYAVTSCGAPLNGTATSTVTGNQVCITYTPNPNFNGADSLCIVVCDNGVPSLCDTAMVVITVTPVNDAPIVTDTTITTPEDSTITVCLPILDVDSGQSYTVSSCGSPLNGTSSSAVIGNQVCVTYTPNAGYNGMDSLCIIVCDNGIPSLCDTAMVVITVTPVNYPPIVNDTIVTTPEDSVITVCLPIADANSGQTYSVSSCGSPLNGAVSSSVSGNQVCITYTPNPNFNGADSLCIVVCDNGVPSLCDTAMIVINVTPVNDAPIVNDNTITTPEDSTITVCLPILDVDAGQSYTVSSCADPVNGTATVSVIGNQVCITYTPNAGFNGIDSLCITVCDNGSPSLCDNAMIYISISPEPTVTIPSELVIPQGFSPNADGTNDLYEILGIGNYPNNKFIIFNRWGNKVFEAQPYSNTWDGKVSQGLRLGGNELPVGTYFYILDLGDDTPALKGYIYLNR